MFNNVIFNSSEYEEVSSLYNSIVEHKPEFAFKRALYGLFHSLDNQYNRKLLFFFFSFFSFFFFFFQIVFNTHCKTMVINK